MTHRMARQVASKICSSKVNPAAFSCLFKTLMAQDAQGRVISSVLALELTSNLNLNSAPAHLLQRHKVEHLAGGR